MLKRATGCGGGCSWRVEVGLGVWVGGEQLLCVGVGVGGNSCVVWMFQVCDCIREYVQMEQDAMHAHVCVYLRHTLQHSRIHLQT